MKILFVIVDGGGNLPPQLAVARALQARGADVHVLGHHGIGDRVRAAGLPFEPFTAGRAFDPTVQRPCWRRWRASPGWPRTRPWAGAPSTRRDACRRAARSGEPEHECLCGAAPNAAEHPRRARAAGRRGDGDGRARHRRNRPSGASECLPTRLAGPRRGARDRVAGGGPRRAQHGDAGVVVRSAAGRHAYQPDDRPETGRGVVGARRRGHPVDETHTAAAHPVGRVDPAARAVLPAGGRPARRADPAARRRAGGRPTPSRSSSASGNWFRQGRRGGPRPRRNAVRRPATRL